MGRETNWRKHSVSLAGGLVVSTSRGVTLLYHAAFARPGWKVCLREFVPLAEGKLLACRWERDDWRCPRGLVHTPADDAANNKMWDPHALIQNKDMLNNRTYMHVCHRSRAVRRVF